MSHSKLEAAATEVKALRAGLEDAGFAQGNSAGELRRGRLWVKTGYVMGEYYVDVWLKDERGATVEPGSQHRVKWHENVEEGAGVALAAALAGWKGRVSDKWPPKGFPGTHR